MGNYKLIALLTCWVIGYACSDSLRFLAIGDWGGSETAPHTSARELNVSIGMTKIATDYKTDFIIALGDNFYDYGVKNVDDPRFQETFEDVYTESSLQTPWYFIAGNHDHYGNASAQVAYTKKSKRWMFPSFYYQILKKIPNTNTTLEILMIDTVLLAGVTDLDNMHDQPHGPVDPKISESQWKWLEDHIKNSKSSYLIVAGHYPVYSIAEHGPTWTLVLRLLPILRKYNVTMYISGHDHNLQHLQTDEKEGNFNFFVTGCAGKMDTSNAHKGVVPSGSSKFFWANKAQYGGFAYIDANQTEMTLTFFNAFAHSLYTQTMYPRNF